MARVVVDTNIFFSALISAESSFAKTMLRLENDFFVCETTLVEIFEHKEKLVKASLWTGDKKLRSRLEEKGFDDFFIPNISR